MKHFDGRHSRYLGKSDFEIRIPQEPLDNRNFKERLATIDKAYTSGTTKINFLEGTVHFTFVPTFNNILSVIAVIIKFNSSFRETLQHMVKDTL